MPASSVNLIINKTCILYFSTGNNSSKSFSSKKKKTIAVQKLLFNKTLLEIRKTKLPYLISDGLDSKASFEEKIENAVNQAFDNGFDKIVLVGDDTPQLSAAQILNAAQSLAKNELSIGPSLLGGAYLISFTKQHYKDGILKNLAWQTSRFYESLLENIYFNNLNFKVLNKFSDLNSEKDIQQFLQNNCDLKISKVLQNLYISRKRAKIISLFIEEGFFKSLQDRGPPLAA